MQPVSPLQDSPLPPNVPPPELADRVRRLVGRVGMREATRILGFCRQTVANLAGGLPMNPASIIVADMRCPR